MKWDVRSIQRFFQLDVPPEYMALKDDSNGYRPDSYSLIRRAVTEGGVKVFMRDGTRPYATKLAKAGLLAPHSDSFYLPTSKAKHLIQMVEG